MNYKFYTKKIDTTGSIYYMVNVEKNFSVLEHLNFSKFNKNDIETIIDGVKPTKDSDEEYKYQTEGDSLLIYSNGFGVQFFDLQHQNKEADLVLPHDTFIKFLEDFKKFVAENS